MKQILISGIRIYQKVVSPDSGILRSVFTQQTCVMYPSCSSYMIMAIEKYGSFRGVLFGLRRITRCHPYQKKLVDFP